MTLPAGVDRDYPLARLTTVRAGGDAELFARPASEAELVELLAWAAEEAVEVEAALAALRELEPRRLIAVFQPHLYSRTKALAARFGGALATADEVGVLDVYAAREEPVGELAGVSGLDVARAVADRSAGRPVWWLRDLESAARAIGPRLRDGDLLVTLGAGDVWKLARAVTEREGG